MSFDKARKEGAVEVWERSERRTCACWGGRQSDTQLALKHELLQGPYPPSLPFCTLLQSKERRKMGPPVWPWGGVSGARGSVKELEPLRD